MSASVDILLPTYNGGRFLPDLLDSLIGQTYTNWRLLVRDDGSSDDTLSLIDTYIARGDVDIQLVSDGEIRLGACSSFSDLLIYSDADYVVFCDQDDYWKPEKLALQLDAVRQLESVHGKTKPILVHTDLEVVDEQLNSIDESFWHYQNLNPSMMQRFERLLVQNCVTGCSVMFNRALRECAVPIPEQAIMHDWWFALVAVSHGVVKHLDVATVKYRQHGSNQVGAKRWNLHYILKMMTRSRSWYRKSLDATYRQAEALLASIDLDDRNVAIAREYIKLPHRGYFLRRLSILKNGFRKMGLVRNLAYFIWV